MHRNIRIVFCILITVLCVSSFSAAFATTYYVAASGGSDRNSCTAAQSVNTPKATINGTVACMHGGDTLYVRAGTYVEAHAVYFGRDPYPVPPNPVPFPNGPSASRRTVISGYPGDARPILRTPDHPGLSMVNAVNIVWNGIDIDGSNEPADAVFTASFDGVQNVTFQNSDVYNCPTNCVLLTDASGTGVISFHVLNHKCHDVGVNWSSPQDPGPHCWYAHADTPVSQDVVWDNIEVYNSTSWGNAFAMQIYMYGCGSHCATQDFTVRNSSFHDNICGVVAGSGTNIKFYNNTFYNQGYQPALYRGGRGCTDGVIALDVGFNVADNVQVYNNTFYNNRAPDGSGWALGNGGFGVVTNAKVANNIFLGNGSNDAINDLLTGTRGYSGQANLCRIFSNGCNLAGNPTFVNAGNGDFHLTSSSPARHAGVNLPRIFTTDKGGSARPAGSAYDIGAYEYIDTSAQAPAAPQKSTPRSLIGR